MSNSAQSAASAFANPPTKGRMRKVHGSYRIEADGRLTHTAYPNGSESDPRKSVIGVVTQTGVRIGNASILPYVEGNMAYGSYQENRSQTEVQRALEAASVPMLPFSVFEQAGLNVNLLRVVHSTGAEEITRLGQRRWINGKSQQLPETVHFMGAALFCIPESSTRDIYYLFDVDRREVKHKIFNPFLVQLPPRKQVYKTVADAYEALKPAAVVSALAKGLDVKRQGEWFFIPTKAPKLPSKKLGVADAILALAATTDEWRMKRLTDSGIQLPKGLDAQLKRGREAVARIPREGELRAGENRPNTVELFVVVGGVTYVKGKVQHTGREHADLVLKEWHVAVPNTATTSWQITGDID